MSSSLLNLAKVNLGSSWRSLINRRIQPADEDSPQPGKRNGAQFGLKELAPGTNPDIDILAIHGIDGDLEGSWTADNGVLWLKDLLPEKIPNARILTYGYDANIHGQEQATDYMHGHAMTFISKLALFRDETCTKDRAIIFVAHSSGGILLKSALIHSYLSNDHHLQHHHAISDSTYGVAFFSTPHQGSEVARFLLDIASSSMPMNNVLLRYIERDSEALQHQLAEYSAISAHYETKFFYELYDTPVAGGVSKRVVPKSSAVLPGAINVEAIGVCKHHANMVKYPSADDDDYRTVSTILSSMVKAAHKKMLARFHKSTEYGGTTIKAIGLTSSQQSALLHLQSVNAARFDADHRPRCLEGTRVDLLKLIFTWVEEDISREYHRIFWLCGQAGTGKTTISSTVASACEEKGQLGASFFFSRDHAERSDPRLVFPTLAQQLGIFHKPFQHSLATILERDPALAQMEPTRQFQKLIIEPLKSCDSFPASTIVVIDALDECKDDNPISTILSILSDHINELPCLKFFITSRPEIHIHGGFHPLISITQSVTLHNIEASVVDADVECYLRNGFSTTAQLHHDLVRPGWPSEDSIKALVRKSGGLFIFAATAMKFILDRNCDDPPYQLAILLGQSSAIETPAPFASLDQLYFQVLRQAFPSGTTPHHRLNLLRTILGTITLLRNPLSPGTLGNLLGLETKRVTNILRRLHSVIVIPNQDEHPIRLIHPSFFDFITTRCSDADFRIDSSIHHKELAIACFQKMKGLKRNICEIADASKLNNEIADLPERIERCISPAMQYACLYWSFHLRGAGGNALQGLLEEFFQGQVLYWIEALSLLGYLREGIRHLKDLSKFLDTLSPVSEGLLEALNDSAQFMTDFFELISCATLQIYRSALPLWPQSNFLHKTYHRELNGGMRVMHGEWLEKSSGVTILRGSKGTINSFDVSPDGTHIVSSSSREVRVWDRGTGTSFQRMVTEPNSIVLCVRFSPDGNRVIAGTRNYIILIWNVVTGVRLQTIQLGGVDLGVHTQSRRTLAVSSDSNSFVGSSNENIFLWATSDVDLPKTLSGHSGKVRSVAFSSDQLLIASGSEDHTIRIWNTINGAPLSTLRGHSSWVSTIAFSPDSKYIASGSSDKDIRIWDASSGIALKTLKGHTGVVQSIAFSPDGTRFISGSADRTLRVWGAISGELLKTIKCPGAANNVGFLEDARQYISSVANVIYIWDASQASDLAPIEDSLIEEPRFSPRGTYIYEYGSVGVDLWDGVTGTYLFLLQSDLHLSLKDKFKGRNHCCTYSATFSSDSTRVVFSFAGGQDRLREEICGHEIWEVASGNKLLTINTTRYSGASFSHDGSQVIIEDDRYDLPPHVPQPTLSVDKPLDQIKHFMKDGWVFASNGTKEERCVWIPPEWRHHYDSASHGRVAIASDRGLVLLDLSGISLAI